MQPCWRMITGTRLWEFNVLTPLPVPPLFFLCVDKDEISQLPALLLCHAFPAIMDYSPLEAEVKLNPVLYRLLLVMLISSQQQRIDTPPSSIFLHLFRGQTLGLSVNANNWETHILLSRNVSEKKSNKPTNTFSWWLHRKELKSRVETGWELPKSQNCFSLKLKSPTWTSAMRSYFSRQAF